MVEGKQAQRLQNPSFRAEQADFFSPVRSCEPVGLRSENLCLIAHVSL